MKDSLKPGLAFEFQYTVPENKTVPYLFPEAPELQIMPKVMATGFMVGLFEWACIKMLAAHLDWPEEQTVAPALPSITLLQPARINNLSKSET